MESLYRHCCIWRISTVGYKTIADNAIIITNIFDSLSPSFTRRLFNWESFFPFIRPSKKLEYGAKINKLGEIKKISDELYSYIQSLQKEADSLQKTYTTLSDDIKILEALKADSLKELKKSKFVVFREQGIFEKIILAMVSFIGGLLAKVFSNYISEILR